MRRFLPMLLGAAGWATIGVICAGSADAAADQKKADIDPRAMAAVGTVDANSRAYAAAELLNGAAAPASVNLGFAATVVSARASRADGKLSATGSSSFISAIAGRSEAVNAPRRKREAVAALDLGKSIETRRSAALMTEAAARKGVAAAIEHATSELGTFAATANARPAALISASISSSDAKAAQAPVAVTPPPSGSPALLAEPPTGKAAAPAAAAMAVTTAPSASPALSAEPPTGKPGGGAAQLGVAGSAPSSRARLALAMGQTSTRPHPLATFGPTVRWRPAHRK
jgi:hypothetical protein